MCINKTDSGFTLIEMIAIIVVVSIAAVGLFGVFTTTVARSADPMLRVQAVAIAQAYLEEALLKAYEDPDDPSGEPACEEASRALYDDVQDYGCINDDGAFDQFGATLAGLGAYNVSIAVDSPGLNATPAHRVVVTVTHDSQPLNISLTGYRANY